MSIAPSAPAKMPPRPLFFGPDGRYYPPSEIGEIPYDDLPGHLELPEDNGEIVDNFRETPQSILLSTVLLPTLERLHPQRDFALGHDCGIYWKLANPPERGVICPDWLYVPGVPPVLGRDFRRSYVLWKEQVRPSVMIEYASEDGSKERDRNPYEGKFWIYENAVQGLYYAIFVVATGALEVHRHVNGRYQPLPPNAHGHYPIDPFGVALGVWRGFWVNETAPWLRWHDLQGNLLPLDRERADEVSRRLEEERLRADEEHRRADEEHRRADEQARLAAEAAVQLAREHRRAEDQTRLADQERLRNEQLKAKLREMGIDPDQLGV